MQSYESLFSKAERLSIATKEIDLVKQSVSTEEGVLNGTMNENNSVYSTFSVPVVSASIP